MRTYGSYKKTACQVEVACALCGHVICSHVSRSSSADLGQVQPSALKQAWKLCLRVGVCDGCQYLHALVSLRAWALLLIQEDHVDRFWCKEPVLLWMRTLIVAG
jgi:hypothetical protein